MAKVWIVENKFAGLVLMIRTMGLVSTALQDLEGLYSSQ